MTTLSSSNPTSAVLWTWYNPISWIRPLYIWTLSWAQKPGATRALAFLSAIESFVFPVPPDPLLLAMGTARPKKALHYALICSVASVVGGVIGYFLGFALWSYTSEFFLTYVFPPDKFETVIGLFQNNAFLTIFLAGFTPIPYKVFTLGAGVAGVNLLAFVLGSLLGRSLRFFLIGGLMFYFGPSIRNFVEKYMEKISIALGVLVVVIFTLTQIL